MASGEFVNILYHTDVTRYLEFRQIAGSYVYRDGRISKVPANEKEAAMSSILRLWDWQILLSMKKLFVQLISRRLLQSRKLRMLPSLSQLLNQARLLSLQKLQHPLVLLKVLPTLNRKQVTLPSAILHMSFQRTLLSVILHTSFQLTPRPPLITRHCQQNQLIPLLLHRRILLSQAKAFLRLKALSRRYTLSQAHQLIQRTPLLQSQVLITRQCLQNRLTRLT